MGTNTKVQGITTYGTITSTTQACVTQRSVQSDYKGCTTCGDPGCLDYVNTWAQYSDNSYANEDFAQKGSGVCSAGRRFNIFDNRTLRCDQSIGFRNRADYRRLDGSLWVRQYSAILYIKAYAIEPTVGAPSLGGETAFTIDVTGSVNLGTFSTTVNVWIQYKRVVDPTWTQWPGAVLSGTGETSQAITPTTITGLTPETAYNVRLYLSRTGTTNPTTDYYSTTQTLSTLPDVPEVTTLQPIGVTGGEWSVSNDGRAIMRGNVDRNGKTDCEFRFAWDSDSGEPYANLTTWTATQAEIETNHHSITGLTELDTYYYRFEIRYNYIASSGTWTYDEGAEVSFTVPASPQEYAAKEAQMFVYEYDAIQGEDKSIYFSYRDISTSSSDRFLASSVTTLHPVADGDGDVLIYIDGVLKATNSGKPDNNITQIGSTSVYSLVLDGTTELTGEDVMIQWVDQGGPLFRDFSAHVRTKILTSQLRADASLGLTNESGFIASGEGTGHGIEAVGGASGWDIYGAFGYNGIRSAELQAHAVSGEVKIDSGASAQDDYYNGGIMLVTAGTTGAGQSRPIIDYDGTSKICVLASPFTVSPPGGAGYKYVILPGEEVWTQASATTEVDAELSGVPTSTSPWGDKLQFLFQRFAYKIDQTATTQTWYKSTASGSDVVLGTRSVDDDGQKQTIAQLSS